MTHTYPNAADRLQRLEAHGLTRLAYSVLETADVLGVSIDTVYQLVRAHRIPHKRIGRRIVIPVDRFEVWLNQADDWESSDYALIN